MSYKAPTRPRKEENDEFKPDEENGDVELEDGKSS